MTSPFFDRVADRVAEGRMSPANFRMYLGAVVSNIVINKFKKNIKNVSYTAVGITTSSSDDASSEGRVNLDWVTATRSSDMSIPYEVLMSNLTQYIATRKPAHLPTFILKSRMGYSMTEISKILGMRKESVHYRMHHLNGLISEFLDIKPKKQEKSTLNTTARSVQGPVYDIQKPNPFEGRCESKSKLWETLYAIATPMTMFEIIMVAERQMDMGNIEIEQTPEVFAGKFVASLLMVTPLVEKHATKTQRSSSQNYFLTTGENPYRINSNANKIFRCLVELREGSTPKFSRNDVKKIIESLVSCGEVITHRGSDDISWGFLETAKNYNVVNTSVTTIAPIRAIRSISVNNSDPLYRLRGENPYNRGIGFHLWNQLVDCHSWSFLNVVDLAQALLDKNLITSARTSKQIGYKFFNNIKCYNPNQVVSL